MAYICQKKSTSFLDDLYMKKKLQDASVIVSAANASEVDAVALILCITQDPSEAVKSVLKYGDTKDESESEMDVSDDELATTLSEKFEENFGNKDKK